MICYPRKSHVETAALGRPGGQSPPAYSAQSKLVDSARRCLVNGMSQPR